jgi:glutamate-ammonia-ligase adenylyltransferase
MPHSQNRKYEKKPHITSLLLSPTLEKTEVASLLQPYGFSNTNLADTNLQSMAGNPQSRKLLAEILPDLLEGIRHTADPDQALNEWERFVELGPNRVQIFQYLGQIPRMIHVLCTIFGNSPAMAQTLIRDPLLLYWMSEESILDRIPLKKALERDMENALLPFQTYDLKLEALRRFKRREMLRIGLRDILKKSTVQETVKHLSELTEMVVHAAYLLVYGEMKNSFGIPQHYDTGRKLVETGFVVLGMGKLGGGELNYSSDIDLIYAYEHTDGYSYLEGRKTKCTSPVFFDQLARELTRVLSEPTHEGALFIVDLRLRPDGVSGALVGSFEEMNRYYRTRGRMWERLALLKARPIAGNIKTGNRLLQGLQSFVLGKGEQDYLHIQEAINSIKKSIHQKMVQRGETQRNVKLGTGGIREIEFIVQALQLRSGAKLKRIRERNTLKALQRLKEASLLSPSSEKVLTASYVFLRDVEHKLQMVNELQTHQLPLEIPELAKCAIRLGYPKKKSHQETAAPFISRYQRVRGKVHKLFSQYVSMEK